VRRRAHDIGAWLRRRNDDAKQEVRVIVGELADIATVAAAEARVVAVNARRTLARRSVAATGRAKALVEDLERTATLMEAIVAQTRVRLAGGIPDGSTRIVSLHDPDARPIAKGRLGKPVEFGYKAQLADNVDGIIVDYEVFMGNPPDAPMLAPAIGRIKRRFGRAPKKVTADRGYGEAGVDAAVAALGVKSVVIPRKGKPGAARQTVQRGRGFVKLVKWRTGSEARVACVKREWGWSKTLMDGEDGAATWAGWGIFGHNTNKISVLVANRTGPPGQEPARKRAG
jgi:IS5 family transposase